MFDERKMGTDRVAVIDIASGKELWNSEQYQNLLPKGTKSEDGADQGELETVKYIYELDAFLISQKASVILVKANIVTGKQILVDRKSTRLNSSHITRSRMPSSA